MANAFNKKLNEANSKQETSEQGDPAKAALLANLDAALSKAAPTATTPPARAGIQYTGNAHANRPVRNGMATPGYYSQRKGKVAGVVAQQLGGRYFFPTTVTGELKEQLDALVAAGVYQLVTKE